mmetsp:Transcript_39550/g.86148  ORF Transcript_39550/g.86148 Transcript_39550/m.86148 type:complete len:212 (+) Transcript_39550:738-1373(+)
MVYSSGGFQWFTWRMAFQLRVSFWEAGVLCRRSWLPWMWAISSPCFAAVASTLGASHRRAPSARHFVRAVCTRFSVAASPSREITDTSDTGELPRPRFSTIQAFQSIGMLEQSGLSTMKRKASDREMSSEEYLSSTGRRVSASLALTAIDHSIAVAGRAGSFWCLTAMDLAQSWMSKLRGVDSPGSAGPLGELGGCAPFCGHFTRSRDSYL